MHNVGRSKKCQDIKLKNLKWIFLSPADQICNIQNTDKKDVNHSKINYLKYHGTYCSPKCLEQKPRYHKGPGGRPASLSNHNSEFCNTHMTQKLSWVIVNLYLLIKSSVLCVFHWPKFISEYLHR